MPRIPTSNLEQFRQHLFNPNKAFPLGNQSSGLAKIKKNLVISCFSDFSGVGFIRNIFPITYLNSAYGKAGDINILSSPVMIFQHEILMRTRSVILQRALSPGQTAPIIRYRQLSDKYRFKLIGEIDDWIWQGDDIGESIPEYNFGHRGIDENIRKASIENMNLMDIETVSTPFLKWVLEEKFKIKPEVRIIPNVVPQYFIGPFRRKPIKKRIEKPRIINTSSPTHYCNHNKLKGDFDNAWCEWIIKNVKDRKIEYFQMGGLPFFFECIKDEPNFNFVNWVNSYEYYIPIRNFKPDFCIGPLMPNFFSYSKSNLKFIESCAYGAAFIGNVFENVSPPKAYPGKHAPSPYDDVFLKVQHDCSVKDIDEIFQKATEPETFNSIIKEQYNFLDSNGLWLESPKNLQRWIDIL